MALSIRPACRIAGRRTLKPVSGRASLLVRKPESHREIVVEHRRARRFSTCRVDSAGIQTASVNDTSGAILPVAPVAASPRPLSLSAQRTAARLAETLELLDGELGGNQEWSRRVETGLEELKSSTGRRGRFAVYGSPESGFRNVVTTLLVDPLVQSDEARQAVLARADEEEGESFVTSYGEAVQRNIGTLVIDSPWLRDAGVELHEITTRNPSRALSDLLCSDVILIVLDPIRLTDTTELNAILPDLIGKSDVYFAINGEIESSGLNDVGSSSQVDTARHHIRQRLDQQLKALQMTTGSTSGPTSGSKISFLSSHKALKSMDALRKTMQVLKEQNNRNASGLAFTEFNKEYLESNLAEVSHNLLRDIQDVRQRAQAQGEIYEPTLSWLERSATRYIVRSLADVLDESREIEALCAAHAQLLSRTRRDLRKDTFTSGEAIKEEMDRVKRGVDEALRKRLVWWKVMSWRVDMVAEEVGREIEERWAVELSQKLAFEAGKLHAIQTDLNEKMFSLLESFSPQGHAQQAPVLSHPYHSPLFVNRLRRLDFENTVTPNALLQPVVARRNQLLRFSVPMLQARAHKLTWTTISLSFLFSSAAWTAAVPLELIEHATGLGAGLLGTMASVRWGVGLWAKAQRKFWQDWARVEEGLEEDLGVDLERLVGRVEGVGLAGLKGIEEMVAKRRERMDRIDDAVSRLVTTGAVTAEDTQKNVVVETVEGTSS